MFQLWVFFINQMFLVLKRNPTEPCSQSLTKVSDQTAVCKNTTIFEDNFNQDSLNENNWILEQYIPNAPVSHIFEIDNLNLVHVF